MLNIFKAVMENVMIFHNVVLFRFNEKLGFLYRYLKRYFLLRLYKKLKNIIEIKVNFSSS